MVVEDINLHKSQNIKCNLKNGYFVTVEFHIMDQNIFIQFFFLILLCSWLLSGIKVWNTIPCKWYLVVWGWRLDKQNYGYIIEVRFIGGCNLEIPSESGRQCTSHWHYLMLHRINRACEEGLMLAGELVNIIADRVKSIHQWLRSQWYLILHEGWYL